MEKLAKEWERRNKNHSRESDEKMNDLQNSIARSKMDVAACNERTLSEAEAKAEASAKFWEQEQLHSQEMAKITMDMIKAESEKVVAERNAVQPGLIEALNGFGEAHLAAKVAENMGLVSLVKGEDAMTVLEKFLGASKPSQIVKMMKDKYGRLVGFGKGDSGSGDDPPPASDGDLPL
jgi:hypothetical protein